MVRCAGYTRGLALGLVAVGTAPSTRTTHPPPRAPRVARGHTHFRVLSAVPTDAHSRIEARWALGGTLAPMTRSAHMPLCTKMVKLVIYTVPCGPLQRVWFGSAATATPTTLAPTTALPTFLPSPSPTTAPTPPPAAGMRTGMGVSTSCIRHVHRHAPRACNVF
jgi:hypothetical protein